MLQLKQPTWIPIHRHDPAIKFSQNKLTVENVRNFEHQPEKLPSGTFIKKEYDLKKLKGVWFAIDPLNPTTSFAHTFYSFDFGDDALVISVEARRKRYSQRPAFWGMFPLFKVYYCASTEQDMFTMRCIRDDNVRLLFFKLNLTKSESKKLLEEIQKRMEHVQKHKKFFNSFYRNCTTEILGCLDRAAPKKLGKGWRRYITGHIDKYLVKRKLTHTKASLQKIREHHDIKNRVLQYKKGNFTQWIRKGL